MDEKNISNEDISNTETNNDEQNVATSTDDYEPKYKNIVLSGGSVGGISHIGVLKKLLDEKLIHLKKIATIAATSAGSLIAILVVLGYSIEEIWNFILSLDMKKMVAPDFFMFLKKCGFDTGHIIYGLFEEIIAKTTGIKHINFRQLYELTHTHIIIVGSCLTTKEAVYYDHINTPNFKVSMAIRISIGMPGFFTPVIIDNKKYIDGAVLNNYPMNLFENKLEETIGVIIAGDYDTDYEYPEQYIQAVINLFLYHYFSETSKKYENNTIYVKRFADINIFDFDVSNEIKIKLYELGIASAQEFIDKLKQKPVIAVEEF